MYTPILLNLKKLYVSVWRIMNNPKILISLPSGIRLQVRFYGTFSILCYYWHKNRSVEMGRVILAPALQKTRAATEAQYLLMKYVFENLNYRRYEWKCDSLNRPSANAAMRLGFTYEGRFRNHAIYKGRSRDTDWFSIIDSEWPALKKRFENWLAPENFDEKGQQNVL